MSNLDGAAGTGHGERDDGDIVRPGGGGAESQLARAVAELDSLAVARTRAGHLRGESVQDAGVAGLVAEAVPARHPAHAGFAGWPVERELAGVHPALGGFHGAREARHRQRPHRRRLLREDHRHLHGARLLHDVRELVRSVAHVDDVAGGGILPGDARLDQERRAAAVDAVTAVILRLHLERRAFARDAPLAAVADEGTRREGHLHTLGSRSEGRARHLHAVEEDGDGVIAGVEPADGSRVVRHVLGEHHGQRLLGAAGMTEAHGDRLQARHEPAAGFKVLPRDDQLGGLAALVHAPGLLRRRRQANDSLLRGQGAKGDDEGHAALHAGLAVDAAPEVPSTGDGGDKLEGVGPVVVVDDRDGSRGETAGALERELHGVVAVEAQVTVLVRRLEGEPARVTRAKALQTLHGYLAARRKGGTGDDLHGAPAHRQRVHHDPELKRPGSNHPSEVVRLDAGGAGDAEGDVLGPASLDPHALPVVPVRLVAEPVARDHLDENLVPGGDDPGVALLAGADDGDVAHRGLRHPGFQRQVEHAPGEREHRPAAEQPADARGLHSREGAALFF